jgi:glucosamine-6-phosphate deaminase
MNLYDTTVDDLEVALRKNTQLVADKTALSLIVADELDLLIREKRTKNEIATVIAPVGPLDYRVIAAEFIRRNTSCENLRVINMDEYLDDSDHLIPVSHPLSFRRFMDEQFYSLLPGKSQPPIEFRIFPDPEEPGLVTRIIDEIDGADLCWAGFGITGHVAFNDPPAMNNEPDDLESFRNCTTRKITIAPMTTAQMIMGGTNGNASIVPDRAITIGMYELLKSRKFHLTFMRRWHSGLWRRALFGPITPDFPGSLIQLHDNVRITMTGLAAEKPSVEVAQATGAPS